ncbi:McrC family protein [Segetibacter koreensis]|uniref:McrC family protein n=1 Tax=Segetibacter koreensis TaxID=398037 RepID=UPI00035D6CC1|nr:hypothetical protein [Segetibacter koreensis]
MPAKQYIRVFEHATLRENDVVDDVKFEEHHLKAMQVYYGAKGNPYYNLTHKGVKFTSYVGVLQVAGLTIEVLPKADKQETDKTVWHGFLVDMLRTVGLLDTYETGTASLRLKSHSILDLYMKMFVKEVRYLLQTGLVKKYRKTESNSFALKGSLLFSKNLQHNLVHAERLYVRHSTYDRENIFNQVLYKTLLLLRHINTSSNLAGKIESLLLDFPECNNLQVNDVFFEKLVFDRKTEAYKKAIQIARLLLLHYHPDIRKGGNEVIALMFDMNKLWEAYVYKKLRKQLLGRYTVRGQVGTGFWQPQTGRTVRVYPDIVVYDLSGNVVCILDTKWKNVSGNSPSDDDLKQMLVYNLYFGSVKSALLYPSTNEYSFEGTFAKDGHGECRLSFMPLVRENGSVKLSLGEVEGYIR